MRRPHHREGTAWVPIVAAIIGSSLVHLVCWPVGNRVLDYAGQRAPLPRSEGVMQVSLMPSEPDRDPAAVPPDEVEEPVPPDKLVNLDRVEDERPPDAADYVSEFDNTTERETRAPNRRKKSGAEQPTGDRPDARDRQSVPSTGPKPGADPPKSGIALPLGGRDASAGSQDRSLPSDNPSDKRDDPGGDVPRPSSLSPRAVAGLPSKSRQERGQSGTHDDLPDGIDEDDGTTLNSRRWKYASFFNRVRNSIGEHWQPEVVHAARDPEGRIHGTKTRVTKLLIKLNPDGSLKSIRSAKKSGVGYLDEEAIRAVRAAAPFANPPAGLVSSNTGLIEFYFGFIFEINGTRRIHRYRR